MVYRFGMESLECPISYTSLVGLLLFVLMKQVEFILFLHDSTLFFLDKINLWGAGFREGYTRLGLLKPFLTTGAATYFFTASATKEDKKVSRPPLPTTFVAFLCCRLLAVHSM